MSERRLIRNCALDQTTRIRCLRVSSVPRSNASRRVAYSRFQSLRMPDSAPTPLVDEPLNPQIVSTELDFAGRVWDVRRDVFEYNGHELTRDYVDHPGAVAVLALDDDGRVLLIQQY